MVPLEFMSNADLIKIIIIVEHCRFEATVKVIKLPGVKLRR